jgi:hypothetical protein
MILTTAQVQAHYLAQCDGDLRDAYVMACEQVALELRNGYARTMDQTTLPAPIDAPEPIE